MLLLYMTVHLPFGDKYKSHPVNIVEGSAGIKSKLKGLGISADMSSSIVGTIEAFVYSMYGKYQIHKVDYACYAVFEPRML